MTPPLPTNVFKLRGEEFFQLVQEQCGATTVDILRYLEVMSADCLLHIEDLFSFLFPEQTITVQLCTLLH